MMQQGVYPIGDMWRPDFVWIYPSRLEFRCGSKRLGRGSVMTAAAVLGTLRFAQHRLCIASYAQLVTFEAIEPLFFSIEHLNSKRDGYRV